MRYLRAFVLGIGILISCWADAQHVEGTVRDIHHAFVSYATVTLSRDSLAHSIIAYDVTKSDGSFHLYAGSSAAPFWIVVRCMGYTTVRKRLATLPSSMLSIEMKDDNYTLSEVQVKGKNIGAAVRGDTIVFHPDAFKNGSEQTMSDVISKLPGISVDNAGNISFQGKKIDKFLVNGKDVLSSGSSSLKTLPADFASGIELLNNYNDGNVGNAFRTEKETALNLTTNGKVKWSGNFGAGGGIKDKFDVKTSALNMGDKLSSSAIVNTNNTSEPVFSIMDYVNANGGLSGITSSSGIARLSFSDAEQNLLMPANDEYKRTAGVGNLNLMLKPTDNYSITIGSIYNGMLSHSANEVLEKYHYQGNNLDRNIDEQTCNRGNFYPLNIGQTWNIGKSISLRSSTKIVGNTLNHDKDLTDDYQTVSADNWERGRDRSFNLLQRMNGNMLVGKGLLYESLDLSYKTFHNNMNTLSSYSLPDIFSQGEQCYGMDRNRYDFGLRGAAGLIYPIYHHINIKTEIYAGYDHHEEKATSQNTEHIDHPVWGMYGGLMKNKGLLRFDLGVRLSQYVFHALIDGLGNQTFWKWEPSFSTELHFSTQQALDFSCNYSYSPTDMDYLSRQERLTGYDEVILPSSYTRYINGNLSLNFAYKFLSLFNRTVLFAYATYNRLADAYADNYQIQNMTHTINYVDGGKNNSLTTMFYFNKGLGCLPVDAKLQVSYVLNTSDISRNAVLMMMETGIMKSTLGFSSHFQMPFNVEVEGLYNKLTNRINDLNINSGDDELGASMKMIFARGRWNAYLTGKWNRIKNDTGNVILRDMDFLASYKMGKWKWELTGTNIFHLHGIRWLSETVTPTYTSYVNYRQHSGYMLFSMVYQI
jgi:hypothetical protein